MSVETWFRIIFAIIALGMAIYLAVALVTGHVRVGGRSVDRPGAPRLYWGAIGKTDYSTGELPALSSIGGKWVY